MNKAVCGKCAETAVLQDKLIYGGKGQKGIMRCPGQDLRYWKFEDIFSLRCTGCEGEVEFFKDDVFRICDRCGQKIDNPKLQAGCSETCLYSDRCRLDRLNKRGKHEN